MKGRYKSGFQFSVFGTALNGTDISPLRPQVPTKDENVEQPSSAISQKGMVRSAHPFLRGLGERV
jgi:hypothetical protein